MTTSVMDRAAPGTAGRQPLHRDVPSHRRALPIGAWLAWGTLATAIVAWVAATWSLQVGDMGPWGLLPVLPVTWYVALGLTLTVCVSTLSGRHVPRNLMAAALCTLVMMIYCTAPLVEEAPRYAWTYKHIGVTRYIQANGTIDPDIDIYHHWPGFFSLTAAAGSILGIENPVRYAAWAEPFFAGLCVYLVVLTARRVSDNARWYWTAGVTFALTNWVGQSYFAPQPFAYTLYLGACLVLIAHFGRSPTRLGHAVEDRVSRLFRVTGVSMPTEPGTPGVYGRRGRAWAAVALFLIYVVMVASHQLTPYAALLALGGLFLLGYLRPVWLYAGMTAATLGYLWLNYGFVDNNFGLLSGLDPFANAAYQATDTSRLLAEKVTRASAASLLTVAVWVLALGGVVRRIRAGGVRSAIQIALLAYGPMLLLFGQNYGGEVRMRVFLFSLPWCAMAIGWLAWPSVATRIRPALRMAVGATASVFLALFVVCYFGTEDTHHIPAGEVRAIQWLYDNGPPGAVAMLSVPNFPMLYGADYDKFAGPNGDDTPNLMQYSDLGNRTLSPVTPDDLQAVEDSIRQFSNSGYLIFSTSQENYARAHQLFGDGGVHRLEAAIGRSPRFQLVYRNPDTRIYELR